MVKLGVLSSFSSSKDEFRSSFELVFINLFPCFVFPYENDVAFCFSFIFYVNKCCERTMQGHIYTAFYKNQGVLISGIICGWFMSPHSLIKKRVLILYN